MRKLACPTHVYTFTSKTAVPLTTSVFTLVFVLPVLMCMSFPAVEHGRRVRWQPEALELTGTQTVQNLDEAFGS